MIYCVNNNKKDQRIFELDFIRGILIFLMCLQHLCWFFYRYLYCGIWEVNKVSTSLSAFSKFTNEFLYINPFNVTVHTSYGKTQLLSVRCMMF
ncbi:MAG: DUF1624 domain-containing protein [Christensenellaceae bacterium]|nr:DUF1624 domain-containing protein [Christensenellaceae bacterium]